MKWNQLDTPSTGETDDDWIEREEGNRLIYILRERNGQSALDVLMRSEHEDFDVTREHLKAIADEMRCPIGSNLASHSVATKINDLHGQFESLMCSQVVEKCANNGAWRSEVPDEIKSTLGVLDETVRSIRAATR